MELVEEFFRQFHPSDFVLNITKDPSAALLFIILCYQLFLLSQIRNNTKK